MRAVRPEEVMKILELTDSLNLHREKVFIPLKTEANGTTTLQSDGRVRIGCPEHGVSEQWLKQLRIELEAIMARSRVN
ncbi:MAG TPA: hypothetical protein VLV31_10010 [Candidatus Acidoferrales bacterium]|nr:hypothetical protein [Candidatus Acidoferrales bacterium]